MFSLFWFKLAESYLTKAKEKRHVTDITKITRKNLWWWEPISCGRYCESWNIKLCFQKRSTSKLEC